MPPKKKDEGPKERPVLGRFKSHLKVRNVCRSSSAVLMSVGVINTEGFVAVQIGIVGLPNVGKSTLFNVLTKLSIPAENFPFCTIEPNSVSLECWVLFELLNRPLIVNGGDYQTIHQILSWA